MIEQSDPAAMSAEMVALKVTEYLKTTRLDSITFEVDPDGVQREGTSWRVRVRPSQEPPKRFEYYEALADVAVELAEREHLNVFLVPSDPEHPPVADELPTVAESDPHRPRVPGKLKQASFTKQTVAQKVAEYLHDCHPEGATLEVDVGHIRKEERWEVPVRPDVEPRKLSQYYEALAEVEQTLEEREHLKVFLVPGPPREADGGTGDRR